MTDDDLATYLRAVRAERRRLERELDQLEAEKPVQVSISFMTRKDALKLLLEALEADEPHPAG